MTTIRITVDDQQADVLKQLLSHIDIIKSVEEEPVEKGLTAYERLKRILDDAKGKNLFAEIEDPSEWQRQIRKEWDSDY